MYGLIMGPWDEFKRKCTDMLHNQDEGMAKYIWDIVHEVAPPAGRLELVRRCAQRRQSPLSPLACDLVAVCVRPPPPTHTHRTVCCVVIAVVVPRFNNSPTFGGDGGSPCDCHTAMWNQEGKPRSASAHTYRASIQILPLMIQDDDSVIPVAATRRVRCGNPCARSRVGMRMWVVFLLLLLLMLLLFQE
jgi:hypothetical protein